MRVEAAVRRGDARNRGVLDQRFTTATVGGKILDREVRQPVFGSEATQIPSAHHAAVVSDDFAQHSRGKAARETREIHGGFGVSTALEHPAALGAQWEDVAGLGKVIAAHRGVGQGADRRRAIRSRDAGADAELVVHRNGERRTVRLGVLGHHQRQAERVQAFWRHGHTDNAAGVTHEERHRLGRDLVGQHDQIALVLAARVVGHDDQSSRAQVFEGNRDGSWTTSGDAGWADSGFARGVFQVNVRHFGVLVHE